MLVRIAGPLQAAMAYVRPPMVLPFSEQREQGPGFTWGPVLVHPRLLSPAVAGRV
ncbi:hypothetical protein ACWGK1_01565 [Streptomyces wedmorensis]